LKPVGQRKKNQHLAVWRIVDKKIKSPAEMLGFVMSIKKMKAATSTDQDEKFTLQGFTLYGRAQNLLSRETLTLTPSGFHALWLCPIPFEQRNPDANRFRVSRFTAVPNA
jgi:hypothetical protein